MLPLFPMFPMLPRFTIFTSVTMGPIYFETFQSLRLTNIVFYYLGSSGRAAYMKTHPKLVGKLK